MKLFAEQKSGITQEKVYQAVCIIHNGAISEFIDAAPSKRAFRRELLKARGCAQVLRVVKVLDC